MKSLLVGYGDGDGVVVDSGLAAVVASGEAAGLAAGAVVSVFCSHAASNAALARMQMYFFIIMCGTPTLGHIMNRSKEAFWIYFNDIDQIAGSYFSPCAAATSAMVNLPSRVLIPPYKAGCFSHAPSNP